MIIPKAAMPVVEVLRRDVKRPVGSPLFTAFKGHCNARWNGCCPMGMHPLAKCDMPVGHVSFPIPGITPENIRAFINFFDPQTPDTIDEALDAIWPLERP